MEYERLSAEENIDMEAQCLYRYVTGSTGGFSPHCHDYCEIFIVGEGVVRHFVNGSMVLLPEGSLVFIRPEDIHGYEYDSEQSKDTSYVNLTFTNETAQQLFMYLSDGFPSDALLDAEMPPYAVLSHDEKTRLLKHVGELNAVNWKDKKQLKLRMRTILAEIFTRYFARFEKNEDENIPIWLRDLTEAMERPENFVHGTEKMTELSGKSREHLSRCVKKYLGVTLSGYINELRANYAANLLLNTNSPVLDVCFECGFQNVSWFYSVFEEKYGISPGEFRRNAAPVSHTDTFTV